MSEHNKNICPHFGICGGCEFQDIPYEKQLKKKTEDLSQLFKNLISLPISVCPSPEIWHYRNKIDPVFSPEYFENPPPPGTKRKTVLGFKRHRKWYDTFPLEDCFIGPSGLPDLLSAIHPWLKENNYEAYDRRTGGGVLHALLLRQAKRTGERMLGILTRQLDLNWNSLINLLEQHFPCKNLYAGLYTRTAEVSQAEEWHLIYGKPYIYEKVSIHSDNTKFERTYQISPASFFQTNTLSAENMFTQIYHWVSEIQPPHIYDLYSGMGTISLILSNLTEKIYSVECIPAAIEDGKNNALLNQITNVQFYNSTVRKFLSEKINESNNLLPPNTLAIADPPREGLTTGVLKKLIQWLPNHIIYVSCNTKSLVSELPFLLEYYTCQDWKAYDFFPHTHHVETLLWLTKK